MFYNAFGNVLKVLIRGQEFVILTLKSQIYDLANSMMRLGSPSNIIAFITGSWF